MEGSTQLWEWDTEVMGEAVELHNSVLRGVLEEHGGHEVCTHQSSSCCGLPCTYACVHSLLSTCKRVQPCPDSSTATAGLSDAVPQMNGCCGAVCLAVHFAGAH